MPSADLVDTADMTAAIDPLTMRRAMGRFATGVAVVTTSVDGTPHGMTVNSLTSVSLDPPLLLVCLTTGARSTDAVVRAGRFAVSILSARQEQLALRFARRGEDHFAGLEVTHGRHEVPVIPDAFAHLECDVERHFTAGDHVVVIGQVRSICEREGEPLGFLRGKFSDIVDRGHDPIHWIF
ncbi:flavin reductase (DIM6/NTAB) family NADH-FMN oxidoreductase RutF [Actinomadura pelletieri DSM 43383]|uniref:Flavin reductase (DIM6/NTAB) family NADH-FMN oxidoreductase RutF n=1 Tax=Actinomadura pelletieri DSM 43383 TaxID=1120940 RepID=A0A495QXA8_9ACTN|nr:flavin reductase family protein [Actinomadura pelletieri]RKS78743.1 flavin reductase (DIM6/NTAB) family NADH-FMN oxidoreductase RutF [Actinomadura pelletieri DSM 43383]